ncbi:MAG: hypothetical protein KAV87_51585 [Desulfobacteraceae bacterium]|nr:hypothetical protein [Desulfobacteraceae bacterium]
MRENLRAQRAPEEKKVVRPRSVPSSAEKGTEPAPSNIPAVPDYSEDAIFTLCNMPFIVAGEVTGYKQEIPSEFREHLSKSGKACLELFGPELSAKYFNVGVFALTFGCAALTWGVGFRKFKMEQHEKGNQEAKARAIQKNRQSAADADGPGDGISNISGPRA